MKKYLLAAVAALALTGSAYAQSDLDKWRNAAPGAAPQPAPYDAYPQPAPQYEPNVLPACESPRLTPTLRRIGMQMGVALFNYSAVTMSSGPDMEFCRMVAWTSAGKRLVNFTVNWTNQAAGQFYVHVTGYSARMW